MEEIENLHFGIDCSFFNNLVRDMYWFEDKDKALRLIRCLDGITLEQENKFFTGKAIFENSDGELKLNIDFNDKDFIKRVINFVFGKKDKLEVNERSRSGWILRTGEYIRVPNYGHIEYADMICEKLKEIKDFPHMIDSERSLELYGAIKISANTILYDNSLEITHAQVKSFKKFFEEYNYKKKKAEINNQEFDLLPLSFLGEEIEDWATLELKSDWSVEGWFDDNEYEAMKECHKDDKEVEDEKTT